MTKHKYTVYAKVTVGVTYTIEVEDPDGLEGDETPEELVEIREDAAREAEVDLTAYAGNGSPGGLLGLGGAALVYGTVEWNIDDCYPEPTDIEVAKEAADR